MLRFHDTTDSWDCKTMKYPTPLSLAWACSDGKFYSLFTLANMSLKYGVVLLSLCPEGIFDFQTGIQQKGVVSLKIHALDCFTWRQCTALGLEGAFISFKATTEHR